MPGLGQKRIGAIAALAIGVLMQDGAASSRADATVPGAQDEGSRREITVKMTETGFEPARVEVRQNELVQVTFVSDTEPHAFTLDAYRVAKRATPGHPSTFEFRADRVGAFAFYCALTSANGRTHDERGELLVRR